MKAFFLALIVLVTSHTHAAVVLNDATLFPGGFFGAEADYRLELTASIPSGNGAVAFDFNFDVDQIQFRLAEGHTATIAEAFAFYSVLEGVSFDAAYALESPPIFTNAAFADWSLNVPLGDSVFLAYWDDRSIWNGDSVINTPTSNDNYGWVKLTHTSSGLIVSDGVTAIGSGILVGSATLIPEPTTADFMIIALTGYVIKRRLIQRVLCSRKGLI